MLVNEIVTNAVKYAYPEGEGVIKISAREIEGQLGLEVSDQGVGLPDGFDIDQPRASLGFKVIKGLVRQLQGHLAITTSAETGTRFFVALAILPKQAV